MSARHFFAVPLVLFAAMIGDPAFAQQQSDTVGIDEKIGQTIAADQMTFTDEAGQAVTLKSLIDRPTILTLVYFRCPGICTPLLNEVARTADQADLTPGKDYRLITISFDANEKPEWAAMKRKNMLGTMKAKTPPLDAWRFLTGDAANIRRITDAVGFRFARAPDGVNFTHPATVIFLTREGRIVRYLPGLQLNPADLEMGVADAAADRPRSFIQNIQQLCYSYDPAAHRFVLHIDRILLAVTLAVAAVLVIYLLRQGRRRRQAIARAEGVAPQ